MDHKGTPRGKHFYRSGVWMGCVVGWTGSGWSMNLKEGDQGKDLWSWFGLSGAIYINTFLSFSRDTPAACGDSEAKDLIRAVAAGYARDTAMWDPSRVCNLHHNSRQCQILTPLSKAKDRTCVLVDIRFINCWATVGTLSFLILKEVLGPGSDLCHSCNHSHSRDNAGSLIHWAIREFHHLHISGKRER